MRPSRTWGENKDSTESGHQLQHGRDDPGGRDQIAGHRGTDRSKRLSQVPTPPGSGRSLLDQRHWHHAEIGEAAEKVARELGRVVIAGAREPDRIVPVAEIHTRRRGRGKSRTMPVRSSSQSMHQATRRASSLGRHGEATLHHRRGEGRRDQVMMDVDSRFLRHASSGPCCEGPITRHDRGSRVPRD